MLGGAGSSVAPSASACTSTGAQCG
jgi:hypothetical protein